MLTYTRDTATGKQFEQDLKEILERHCVEVVSQSNLGWNPLSCRDHVVDFSAVLPSGETLVVEAKMQNIKGTAENKLDHELLKLVWLAEQENAPQYLFVVCGGDGWTKGFLQARMDLVLPLLLADKPHLKNRVRLIELETLTKVLEVLT